MPIIRHPVIISDKEINSVMGVEEVCSLKTKLWLQADSLTDVTLRYNLRAGCHKATLKDFAFIRFKSAVE